MITWLRILRWLAWRIPVYQAWRAGNQLDDLLTDLGYRE